MGIDLPKRLQALGFSVGIVNLLVPPVDWSAPFEAFTALRTGVAGLLFF